VAEDAEADLVPALVADRKSHPGPQADSRADDPRAAEEATLAVVHVHRAALAMRAAGRLAEELGHRRLRVAALRQEVAVVAVGVADVVVGSQGGDKPAADRLLPDVEVQVTADLVLGVGVARAVLE